MIDARFFATAVLTQRETGGNLSEVLDNLASVIRERFKVKRQVRVVSAHGRITGVVLGLLPPTIAALLFLAWLTERRVLLWPALVLGLGFASGLSLSGHSGDDGAPRYDVHNGAKGWLREWTAEVPGATSAAVAWLR